MLTALVVPALALLVVVAATAAPAIRSGRRTGAEAVPLVAPAGTGFGGATAIVASAARPAADRTSPAPRSAGLPHRWVRPATRPTAHLAA